MNGLSRGIRFAALALLLGASLSAQNLSDRFKTGVATWEATLLKGDATAVRKAVETLLQQEASRINTSDYNEMHTMVGAYNLAARACVQEGSWEDAVNYLMKASSTANANLANLGPDNTLAKLRKEHEAKLPEWRDLLARQESVFKEMEAQPGLTANQMKQRQQVRGSIDEIRNAIGNSEKALKTMDAIAETLHKEAELCAKSLDEWQKFIAKEKADMDQAGGSDKYVPEKLEQVKADDARPRVERLAYCRRLLRLDSSNADCKRFVNSLLGIDEEHETAKVKSAGTRKGGKKKG